MRTQVAQSAESRRRSPGSPGVVRGRTAYVVPVMSWRASTSGGAGSRWAWAAFGVGLAYALVSVAWGLGSTWALGTVGGALEREGRSGSLALAVIVWLSVLLKLTAAGLGLAAVLPRVPPGRLVILLAWAAAAVLVVYGAVLTVVGLLVQGDVIHASQNADRRALAWHAYLWDPWFLLWGLLLAAALWRSRAAERTGVAPSRTRSDR